MYPPRSLSTCLALMGLLLLPAAAAAHSLSSLEGEAVVHPDKIELELVVKPDDILLSAGMTTIISDTIQKADIIKGSEAHKKYLLNGVVVEDARGQRLAGKIVKLESPGIPGAGIPLSDLMGMTFVYHLEYPLATPPERLGFRHRLSNAASVIPVNMLLTVRREGQDVGVVFLVPEGDKAETIALDWKGVVPPPVAATKPVVPETSDAFLYIQNDQVRLEIMMPILLLETWIAVPRANPAFLEVGEQAALRPELEKLFTAHGRIEDRRRAGEAEV